MGSSAGGASLEVSHWGHILGGLLAFLPVYLLLVRPQADVSSHRTPALWSHPCHKGLYIPSQTSVQINSSLFCYYVNCFVTTTKVPSTQCWGLRGQGLVGRALTSQPLRQSSIKNVDTHTQKKNVDNGSFHITAVPTPLQTLGRHKAAEGRNAHTSSREGRERKGSMA